jgi:hypothetical protein
MCLNVLIFIYTIIAVSLFVVVDILITGKLMIVRNLALGIALYLCAFMVVSLKLFMFDLYSFMLVNTILTAISIITIVLVFFIRYKKTDALKQIEVIRYMPIALIIVIIVGFLFTFQKFELFGMGQDQGVYQINALLMTGGLESNVISIKEYNLLTNDEDRQLFLHYLITQRLTEGGFDSNLQNVTRGTVPQGLHSDDLAFFHGLPNLPALLSVSGLMFGAEHIMMGLTLPYLISIILVFLTLDINLGLKKSTSVIATLIFALSPLVIWISKASLTEIYTAMIISMFCFFITDKKAKTSFLLWIPITAFAFIHVSIYGLMPMFIVLLFGLAMYKRDFGAWLSGVISVMMYCVGYIVMTHAAPSYTFMNYSRLIEIVNRFGFDYGADVSQYPFIFTVCALTLGLFGMLYIYSFKLKKNAPNIKKIVPFILIAICIVCAVHVIRRWHLIAATVPHEISVFNRYYGGGRLNVIPNLRVFTVLFSTGFIFLFIVAVQMLRRSELLYSKKSFPLTFMLVYSIVIFSSVLVVDTPYYYYYARYTAPYLPVAALIIGVSINSMKPFLKYILATLSISLVLPFSLTLALNNDISFMDFRSQREIVKSVKTIDEGSIIIADDFSRRFFFNDISYSTNSYIFVEYILNQLRDTSFTENRRVYSLRVIQSADEIPEKYTISVKSRSSTLDIWITGWKDGPARLLRPIQSEYWIVLEEYYDSVS